MYRLKRPWLFLPSQWAHDWAPLGLKFYTQFKPHKPIAWNSLDWQGLHFANPMGIAGGVDKNAEALPFWWKTGMGFAEVGTVTPKAQGPNPDLIMDRDVAQQWLWNKMGFPNAGAESLLHRLEALKPYPTPLFVNIGKNRDTVIDEAHKDYALCAKLLHPVADLFVVNISSPNTKDLRSLQSKAYLKDLIDSVQQTANNTPILVKLSPDLEDDQLRHVLDSGLSAGVQGFILTNTTSSRPRECNFPTEGGLSGKALAPLSEKALKTACSHLGSDREQLMIVSAGGIFTKEDVQGRLSMGAKLVQCYSSLVFEGPGLFGRIMRS